MEPQDSKSKRPSLLAPEDAPDVHKSNSAISLSEIQENRPPRRLFWAVAPWIIGAFCVLLVIGGVRVWQAGNGGAPAPIAPGATVADAAPQATTQPPSNAHAAATPPASFAHVPPKRSVATIIDYTTPVGSNTSTQSSQPASNENTGQHPDSGKTAESSAPSATATDTTRLATLSINLNEIVDKQPPTKIREIEVLGAAPLAEPEPQQDAARPEEADADVNIVATLMSYIDQRDASSAAGINIPLDAPAGEAQIATTGKPLDYPLRAQLQECPPANTVEGIECRQQVCQGHRGQVPACPAPDDSGQLAIKP